MDRMNLEFKLAPDGTGTDAMTFSGYGAYFKNVDAYGDVIAPGAFAETLADAEKDGRWPAMLLQHGAGLFGSAADNMPIGVWTSLKEDARGLKVEGKLAETARAREAYALMKMQPRPAIDGLSIGYIPKAWEVGSKPKEPRRTLTKVELIEVSLVTFPANPKARVQNVKGADMTEREFEAWLQREAGFTRSQARVLIARGFKAVRAMPGAGDDGDVDDTDLTVQSAEQLLRAMKV